MYAALTAAPPVRAVDGVLGTPPDRSLRASDAEREGVVAALAEHSAAGRLTLSELDQRADAAYAAVTLAELDRVLVDLPELRPRAGAAPAPPNARRREELARRLADIPAAPATSWALTAVICLAVWMATSLATGGLTYFWPMWVIGPWGLVLLHSSLGGRAQLCGGARARRHTTS